MPLRSRQPADRLFTRNGFRHYRRSYSVAEARWGVAVGIGLAMVLAWVVWRGTLDDPALHSSDLAQAGASSEVGRGPLPKPLASVGWTEGSVSEYGPDNVYEKINGRAGYFKSFGFRKLFAVTLTSESGADSIDIELYDLGTQKNALGAYAGERAAGAKAESADGALFHIERNALFLASGPYYLRAVGSDDSEVVTVELSALRSRLGKLSAGAELPWAFAFFSTIGARAGQVAFHGENVFSFDFADDFWIASRESGIEQFISLRDSEADALELARQLAEGFASQGTKESTGAWVKDEYLGSYSTASVEGKWLLGVRRAADLDEAKQALASLREALRAMPDELRQRAELQRSPARKAGEGEDEDEDDSDEPGSIEGAYE